MDVQMSQKQGQMYSAHIKNNLGCVSLTMWRSNSPQHQLLQPWCSNKFQLMLLLSLFSSCCLNSLSHVFSLLNIWGLRFSHQTFKTYNGHHPPLYAFLSRFMQTDGLLFEMLYLIVYLFPRNAHLYSELCYLKVLNRLPRTTTVVLVIYIPVKS